MESFSHKSAAQIQRIGEAASSFLIAGSNGKVLAAFSKAIYLVSAQDDLFWLAAENTPMHRRAAQLNGRPPKINPGSSYTVKDQQLIFNSDDGHDFSQARRWKSANHHTSTGFRQDNLKEHLFAFISLLEHLPPANGFGILVPNIQKIIQGQTSSQPNSPLDGAAKFAWPSIQEITKACLARDLQRVLELAEELVGLGEGLTPSGDDFIGGLLFCLQSIYNKYRLFKLDGYPELDSFLRRSESRTNLISFTLLKDHAAGHGSEALHNLINDLLTGQPLDILSMSISDLIQIGHSTGWDLFTGVLTGLLVTVGMHTANTPQVRASLAHSTV